jgi:hypothetical protein
MMWKPINRARRGGARWWAVCLVVLLGVLPIGAAGTGTVTTTYTRVDQDYTKIAIVWTSTAGGAVSGNPFALRRGSLVQIQFVPDAGGTQPTDQYDVTLVDAYNVDLLNGQGQNLSNASASILQWNPQMVSDSTATLDLVVANAGNAKAGTVYLWVRQ